MQWYERPVVLALAGALAIHVILWIAFDAAVVYTPHRKPDVAPRVELVDISVPPPPPKKLVEPPPSKAPEPARPAPPAKAPPQKIASAQPRPATSTPPKSSEPPPPSSPPASEAGGHERTLPLPEGAAPGASGKRGPLDDRIGPRGKGTGTGSGSGSGSAEQTVAAPVSVAMIKTAAKPKGDFSYFDGKDYPAEAKQLGLEGDIKVRLIVDENGKVKRRLLLTRLGHGLDELALAHAAQLDFEPARDTDDRAVTSVVVWTFHMTLPK